MLTPKTDPTGQTFGELKVIRQANDYITPTGHHRTRWLCECSCGRQLALAKYNITHRATPNCGYKPNHPDNHGKPSVKIGDTFVELEVIAKATDHYTPSRIKKPQWLCRCSCGHEIIVQQQRLALNEKTHCGCLRKTNLSTRKRHNDYDLMGTHSVGCTTNGEPFWFDLDQYDKIKLYHWYYNKRGCPQANIKTPYGKSTTICLHQVIIDAPPDGYIIDHKEHPQGINAHKIDNRKENLRFVTVTENNRNRNRRRNNKSRHIGVSKYRNGWIARIKQNGKLYTKKFPPDQFDEACAWRKMMEKKLFGEHQYKPTDGTNSTPNSVNA